MWDDQFAEFAQTHRVLRYDVRGFGDSTNPPGSFAHHDDLAALLRALDIARATLIAVSMGSEIALQTALTFPDLVSGLVLSTTRAAVTEPSPAIRTLWLEADAAYEAGDLAGAVEIELRGWVDGPFRMADQVDPVVRERVRIMNAMLWERIAREPDAGEEAPFEPPFQTRFAEIDGPALLITGDLDQPEVVSSMDILATALPYAENVRITGTAHLPSMERPEEFNRLVSEFLQGHEL